MMVCVELVGLLLVSDSIMLYVLRSLMRVSMRFMVKMGVISGSVMEWNCCYCEVLFIVVVL